MQGCAVNCVVPARSGSACELWEGQSHFMLEPKQQCTRWRSSVWHFNSQPMELWCVMVPTEPSADHELQLWWSCKRVFSDWWATAGSNQQQGRFCPAACHYVSFHKLHKVNTVSDMHWGHVLPLAVGVTASSITKSSVVQPAMHMHSVCFLNDHLAASRTYWKELMTPGSSWENYKFYKYDVPVRGRGYWQFRTSWASCILGSSCGMLVASSWRPGPSEYDVGVAATRPHHLVYWLDIYQI